jgi:membrane-associated phospholipid phosphatase
MYLGVHYPSDIVAGILVGGLIGFAAQVFAKKTLNLCIGS